jgi:hypothetical protein
MCASGLGAYLVGNITEPDPTDDRERTARTSE